MKIYWTYEKKSAWQWDDGRYEQKSFPAPALFLVRLISIQTLIIGISALPQFFQTLPTDVLI